MEGVEDELPGDQPFVEDPKDPEDPESTTTTTEPTKITESATISSSSSAATSSQHSTSSAATSSQSSTSSAAPATTDLVVYPADGTDITTNTGFRSDAYKMVDVSTVYESLMDADDVVPETTLFWDLTMTAAQIQNLSSKYKPLGVSLMHPAHLQNFTNSMQFYFQILENDTGSSNDTGNLLAAREPSWLDESDEDIEGLHARWGNDTIEARDSLSYILLPETGDPDPSVAIISQQPIDAKKTGPRHPIDQLNKYACNAQQGEGATVYILDRQFKYIRGAMGMSELLAVGPKSTLESERLLTHCQEFPNIASYRNLYPKYRGDVTGGDWGHPIQVASKVVSKTLGACQKVDIVFVGLPRITYEPVNMNSNRAARELWPIMEDAFKKIRDDIKGTILGKNRRGKAFINVSFGFDEVEWPVDQKMIQSMKAAVDAVTKEDALVVLAAPYGLIHGAAGYPSLLGASNPRVVVVGATDINGIVWNSVTPAPYININAVGRLTKVIGRLQNWEIGQQDVSGTSFSKASPLKR